MSLDRIPAPPPRVLDADHLDALCGDNRRLELEMLQSYVVTAESRLLTLRTAIGLGDASTLRDAARALGVSSRCIGAHALADACVGLESIGAGGLTTSAVPCFADARREYRRLRAVIAARLRNRRD